MVRLKIFPWTGLLTKATPGYAFSHDSRYFVLAERHKSRDTVGVYDARDGYKLLRVHFSFLSEETYNAKLMRFAPSITHHLLPLWHHLLSRQQLST